MAIFGKHAFGLDISDASVEAMVLTGSVKRPKLETFSRVELPDGIVENGVIKNPDALLQGLLQLSQAASPKPILTPNVIVSLPESRVLLSHLSVPKEGDAEKLVQIVRAKAQEIVPYEPDEVVEDFRVVGESADGFDVLFVAVERAIVERFRETLERAKLKPVAFDLESASLARSLARRRTGPVALLDIGARTSILTVVEAGNIQFSENFSVAGDAFTAAIAQRLRLPKPKAETLKRTAGLDPQREKGRVLQVLQSHLTKLVEGIQHSVEQWEIQHGRRIETLVLCGGSSLLPRLPEYLKENLPLNVEVGDPLDGIDRGGVTLGSDETVVYSTVTGLALRGIGPDPVHSGLNLLSMLEKKRAVRKPKVVPVPSPVPPPPPPPPVARAKTVPSATDVPIRVVKTKTAPPRSRLSNLPVEPAPEPPAPPPTSPPPPPPASPKPVVGPSHVPPAVSRGRTFVFIGIIIVALGILGTFMWGKFGGSKNENANASAATNGSTNTTPSKSVPVKFSVLLSSLKEQQTGTTIPARAVTATVSGEKESVISGDKTVDAQATGRVTITSTWSFEQPLVATTRLLSKEGVLFRIKDAVTVPANGSVDVDVYADQAGASGNIGPTTFTIPGLNATKQTLITAKNAAAMTGGTKTVGAVADSDVASANAALKIDLTTKALEQANAALATGETLIAEPVSVTTAKQTTTPKVGSKASSVTVSAEMTFTFFTVTATTLTERTLTELSRALPVGSTVDQYTLDASTYTLDSYDETTQTATVDVATTAKRNL